MKKTVIFLTSFALAAACYALPEVNPGKAWRPQKSASKQKSVSAMPKMVSDTMIQCGNKKVSMGRDGSIKISNSAGEIMTISLQYVFRDRETNTVDWITTTSNICKIRRQGNSVVWELWKKHKLHTWKIADQKIEILKDGNLKLSAKAYAPANDRLECRSGRAAYFISFPVAGNEGKKFTFNDEERTLSAKLKNSSLWNGRRFDYNIFPDNPAEFVGLKSVNVLRTGMLITFKRHRISYDFMKDNTCSFLIDLRKSAEEKIDTANSGAGINFKQIENIELPWRGKRNLLANSGFEQGLINWKSHSGFYSGWWPGKWEFVPFEISNEAYHGSNSLLMRGRDVKLHDFRNLRGGINLSSGALLLQPGTYTLSFYARTSSGKARLSAWIQNFHTRNISHYAEPHSSCYTTVTPTKEWKRYTKTMIVEKATPTVLSINVAGKSEVLIDAIQFERGTKATAYEFPAAAGVLLTSAEDNFISSSEKVDAKVKIFSKPNVSGSVAVRVKNFFGEIVYNKKHSFKTGSDGYATVALPFDKFGKGLFMVRFDYQLADGSRSFDLTRFAVADYLNNTHRLKNLFSDDYGHIENHYNFIKILDRWRKIGIGAKSHLVNREPMFSNKYREYGVEPTNASIATMLWGPGTTKVKGFGIADKIPRGELLYTTSSKFLVKDHNSGNNGVADDAYFERVAKAAEQVARTNSHIKCWTLYAEIRAKFANEWWSREATDEKATELHIRYLKAVVDGVRRGNPEAKIFQDAPCNMRPDGGIAETVKLLSDCNKYGVKFDLIAIHPYRFSPESPDLDSDAQTLFKALKKVGYGDDTKVMWPELMHWGPYNIPQWGTESSTWGATPRTWPGWTLTYDISETEKLSAAWRARSWLVALKYSDRITTATSGSGSNNFAFDEKLTPYATQMIFNTLGNVLGDCRFKKDIRFAPFIRSYVFEDAEKRPVAAVWCHMENVDNGYIDAPVAEADFGSSLESVIDLMNCKRAFTAGKFRFPVSSFPIFLRGKKGTLNRMIKALENAVVISGEGISPVEASANPVDNKTVRVTLKNFLSSEFKGTFNGKRVVIPGSGETSVDIPAPVRIVKNRIVKENIKGVLKSDKGQTYEYDLAFTALAAGKIGDDVTFDTIAWSSLPVTRFTSSVKKKEKSGDYRIAWNKFGLFLQVQVKDSKFIHTEYPRTAARWQNDCLQVYIDTMANARSRQFKGYDEDDYDYAVFPNSKGDSSIVWRNRSVEQQLGLATQAPKDQTVAEDIPSSFSNENGVLTYRVFFPAKYLLPAKMQSGWVMALGLHAANSDMEKVVSSALTNTSDSGECFNRPHVYPALLLEE